MLQRFQKAAEFFKTDYILRLTSDNPFIDLFYLDCLIQSYLSHPVDLATIQGLPLGMTGEIFKTSALYSNKIQMEHHKEHVSLHIKENLNIFCVRKLRIFHSSPEELETSKKIRLTLDEKKDLEVLQKVFTKLSKKNRYFGWKEIYHLFQKEEEIFLENQKVHQITFSLPKNKIGAKKNRVLIICGDPKYYGSGHFQRMKYVHYILQLKSIYCNLQYELPKDYLSYDLILFDKRDCKIPKKSKKVLLLDHFGIERNSCPYYDLLLHPANKEEFDTEQILIPPMLESYKNQTENQWITVYAGNTKQEIFYLDTYLKSRFSQYKIIRIGGQKPKENIEYFPYLVNSQFYQILSQSHLFVSYYGQSLMEALFLQKKVLQFSISDQHHLLSQLLEKKYNISYIGNLNALQEKDFFIYPKIKLSNKGYKKLTNKIYQILEIDG